jgi:hypothetical protein
MLSNYEFAKMLQRIAAKKTLTLDDESLLAVQANNRMCLCCPTKKCPCSSITDDGCPCGLFVASEAV